MTSRPIYLDNNATTPLDPRVLDAMLPWLKENFGNAASQTHSFGIEARAAVERSRALIAGFVGGQANEVVFTSGATESTNLALKGAVEARGSSWIRILTAPTEHKATLDTVADLASRGAEVEYLAVDREGRIAVADVEKALNGGAQIVSLMMVNNEIGVIQDVAEIGKLCRDHGALFHCDAAQAYGKIPIDVRAMNIDLLSVSAHKIYGPKGLGFLVVRESAGKVAEQIHGGGHEGGRRSGTLNVPGIVGLAEATRWAQLEMAEESQRILGLREHLRKRLEEGLGDLRINGSLEHRVCGNLNLSFGGIDGEHLLMALPGIAVSTGSACDSERVEPSYVLKAIGLTDDEAVCALRFGIGRFNSQEEVDRAADQVIEAVKELRAFAG